MAKAGRDTVGGIVLILIGVVFLLDEFDVIGFGELVSRWWPLILIAIGLWQIFGRGESGEREE